MFIKVKKVGSWYEVYYTKFIKVSCDKSEFYNIFGKFWSIGLFNTRYVLVPENFIRTSNIDGRIFVDVKL